MYIHMNTKGNQINNYYSVFKQQKRKNNNHKWGKVYDINSDKFKNNTNEKCDLEVE